MPTVHGNDQDDDGAAAAAVDVGNAEAERLEQGKSLCTRLVALSPFGEGALSLSHLLPVLCICSVKCQEREGESDLPVKWQQ